MRRTLLLNQSYEPLSFITEQRAVKLMCKDKVEVMSSWDGQPLSTLHDMRPPAIIRMKYYVRRVFRPPRFTRSTLFNRDNWCCQYCNVKLDSKTATVDHILPRALGGRTSWLNCVTSCKPCNKKKANSLLADADVELIRKPTIPFQYHCWGKSEAFAWFHEWDLYVGARS